MYSKLSLFLIFLITTNHVQSQNYKFGKVSKEELIQTNYSKDSSANAVILYDKTIVRYDYNDNVGFTIITEVHKRIKFFNKDGFDYADQVIYLYHKGSKEEKLINLKGATYTLSNNQVVETKLKKEGVFKNQHSEYLKQVKFTMPAIKEGSIVEFKYTIVSPFIGNIDKIDLQYKIPISKQSLQLVIPEYFHFNPRRIGYLPINMKETKSTDYLMINDQKLEFMSHIYKLDEDDVPAFKIEPYSGNIENYISGILFELDYTKFPNSSIDSYSTTWKAVINNIYKDPRFGGELKKTNYFKADLDAVLNNETDQGRKVKIIFNFLRNRMAWNEVSSVFPRKSLKKPYEEQVGNAAEINLILISMLKYAGIKVYPVLVTTNSLPLSLFPTLEGLNYVIARVKIEDEIFFLDATDKYGFSNVLPRRVQQGVGRLINEVGNSELVIFRDKKPSKYVIKMMCKMNDDGIISGKQRVNRTFNSAHDFRTQYASLKTDKHMKRLQKRYNLNSISDYNLQNIEELEKPVQETFSFETSEEVEIIGDELYFSPLLFLREKENIFKSDSRNYPIDFTYSFVEDYHVFLQLPEDYQISSMPEDKSIALPNNLGLFVFKSSYATGTLQLSVKTKLNESVIASSDYEHLKKFYSEIIEKENEAVVLKKK